MALTTQRILLGRVKGEKGDKGDPGSVRVAATNTIPPGQPASVTEGGTPPDRTLTFNIPQGLPGTGGGDGGVNLRSVVTPLVYRIPVNWPFAPSVVLGAMDTLGWGAHRQDWTVGRVWYFTNHATQGIVDGWQRTRRNPNMQQQWRIPLSEPPEILDMWRPLNCPVNFATSGYRGNWCRSMTWAAIGESLSNPYYYLATDFDGLAFTNSNRALWIYGRGNLPDRKLRTEAIDLPGLANAPITSMWAGVTAPGITAQTPDAASRIWVIQNNRLYLCHLLHNDPRVVRRNGSFVQVDPGVHRRITGAANFTFTEVIDPALPTTMSRVYAEGLYAAVWGMAPTNRLAFFDGTQWYALTIPFNFTSTYVVNAVLIFANGRIGLFNGQTGDYYTCDNPSAGATAEWILRYRMTTNYVLMTNGFNRGIPQWVPRSTSSTSVYCQFNGASDDGGRSYANPRGANQSMSWPGELYCSTSRPDIVPSTNATHGYAYPWGTKQSYVNISGRNTIIAASSYYTPVYQPHVVMPDTFVPGIPNQYTDGASRRFGPFTTKIIIGTPPENYQGRVLEIWVGMPQTVLA